MSLETIERIADLLEFIQDIDVSQSEQQESIEEAFLEIGLNTRNPDLSFDIIDMDPYHRQVCNYDHPFSLIPSDERGGVYLFFDVQNSEVLYVGRAQNMSQRLSQHLKRSNFEDRCFFCVAWLISDERKRMLFEHFMIGESEPIYNKG